MRLREHSLSEELELLKSLESAEASAEDDAVDEAELEEESRRLERLLRGM